VPAYVDVVPTAAHIDERLLRALERGTSAIAPTTVTVDDLVAALHARLLPTARCAPPVLERLVVAESVRAELAAQGDEAREHGGTVETFARAVDALRRHGIAPADVLRAVEVVPEDDAPARARLRLLAGVAERAEAALAARGYVARASIEGRLASVLARPGEPVSLPPPLAPGDRVVRLLAAHALDPTRVALFAALARALGPRGGRVEIQVVCEPRRERLPASVDGALRALEAEEDLPIELSFGLRDPDAPAPHAGLVELVTALAAGGRAAPGPVVLAEAHGPDEEARWVAAQIERWLAHGYAPHEIAIAVREGSPDVLTPLGRALDEARIPWTDGCAAALASSALARAIVALPRMVARGAPCDETMHLLAVLTGHAPRAGRPAPYRVAQALRQLRVSYLFDPELDARLAEAPRRGVPAPVVREAQALRDALRSLASEADVATHVARLAALLARLGVGERHLAESQVVMASASYDPGAQAILRAIARDEVAVRATLALLGELGTVEEDAPPGESRVSVAAFADMLADAAAARALPLPSGSARGVLLAPARALVGRSVRALAVVGLNEGGFPAYSQDDGPLGDAERRALLRTTGRLLERSGGREEETLLFLSVVACATEALALSGARHDAGGRALPPSPFMVDVRRATGMAPVWAGRDPLARSREVPPRGPERAVRAWVQVTAAPPAPLATAIASARTRTGIELERRDFFAGRRAEPGRFSGRVDHDPAVVAELDLRGYGSARRPVDVTTLERAARCGFRAFSQEVLQLQAPVEPGAILDSKDRGHMLHVLVEAGQLALRDARGLPAAEQLARVAAALDEAGARFAERVPHADRDLLRADLLAIRRQVEKWLRRRMDAQDRWEMLATEVAFGPRRGWPSLEIPVENEEPIVIKGRIDGVERMDGEVRVVEFKSGRGEGYRKRLREGVLDTQFQLVVYAAALTRAHRAGAFDARGTVDGVYVGFRDQSEHGLREVLGKGRRGSTEPVLDVDTVVAQGAEGAGELAQAVRRAILPVRQGVFAPRPRDCDFCDAGSLCRIERNESNGDE
jgi:hypothetical protein